MRPEPYVSRHSGEKEYLQYLSLGAEIAAALALPLLFGYWLDGRLGTSPWMLLAGALAGIVILIGVVIRISRSDVR